MTYNYLQLFADAGSLVNTTGGYVNSTTGAVSDFSGSNSLSGELKSFYDTELLENARVELFYAQFAKTQPLPTGRGSSVEWRKWNTFDRASQLQEAVIPTGQKFGMSTKTGSINQYGTYATVSDKLELHAFDDVILGATEEMGASAAETQEVLIRDGLYTNTNVIYCDNINSATGEKVGDSPASNLELNVDMADGSTGAALLTPDMIARAATKLKKDRVPTIKGRYFAVIHPSVSYDLRKSSDWLEAHKYAAPEELFTGEIGELHGVRFIENVFAPVIGGGDLASDSRNLTVNAASGYTGAITEMAFDGGTVATDALVGRYITVNGVKAKISHNTASKLSFASTDFGTVADNAVIYPGEGAAKGGMCYATYFFGKDAFGIIDPKNGGLEMIVHDKSQIGGPLNQFSTIGYKLETNGVTMLYPERVLRVMSTTSYSNTDEPN